MTSKVWVLFPSMDKIPQIVEFGNAVLAGAKPGTVVVPEYKISAKDFQEFANHVTISNDYPLKVGFANSIYRLLLLNYENSDEESAKIFRDTILLFALKNTDRNTLSGILKSTNEILSQTEGKWPELISFLLRIEDDNNYFRGQFIAVATYIRESDFASANKESLIAVIDHLLKLEINLPISSLLLVLSLTKSDISLITPHIDTIWNAALKCAETSDFHAVCSALHDLSQIQGFGNVVAPCVSAKIYEFAKSENSLEERIKQIHPIIKLFPFIDEKSLERILQVISNEVTSSIQNAIEILDLFNETEVDLIEEGKIVTISTYIRILVEGENPEKGLIFLAPFADQVLDDEEFENNVNSLILKTLDDENNAVCALYALRSMASRMQKANLDLFKKVINYLPRDDIAGEQARQAMEALIETQLFTDDVYVKTFVESFNLFAGKTSLFVRLALQILDSLPEVGLAVAQGLFEFSVPLIAEGRSDEEKAVALSFFAQLAEVDKDYVVDRLEDMMTTAMELMDSSNTGCVAASADFLASVSTTFETETRERVFARIPQLMSIVKREREFPAAHRNAVATSLSDIVSQFDLRDIAEELAEIAMTDLSSKDLETQSEAVNMLYIVCRNLLPDVAQSVFTRLAAATETMTDNENAETAIKAMKDIMKKYKIDRESASNFVRTVFEGKIQAIGQIDSIENVETEVFELLKAFVTKFKNDALIFVRQVIGVIPFIDTTVLGRALSPVIEALRLCTEREYLKESEIKELGDILVNQIGGEDPEVINNAAETLVVLIRDFPNLMDMETILKKVIDMWELCDENEDKDQTCSLAMVCFALASQGILNPTLLAELAAFVPYDAETFNLKDSVELMKKAAETIKDNDVGGIPLEYLCRVALMKKSQLDEYEEIPQNFQQQVKQFIKDKLKNDNATKEVLTQTLISKNFGKVLVASLFK